MSDFVCNLKIPFVVLSVLTIVWWTGSYAETSSYYPPAAPDLYGQQASIWSAKWVRLRAMAD